MSVRRDDGVVLSGLNGCATPPGLCAAGGTGAGAVGPRTHARAALRTPTRPVALQHTFNMDSQSRIGVNVRTLSGAFYARGWGRTPVA